MQSKIIFDSASCTSCTDTFVRHAIRYTYLIGFREKMLWTVPLIYLDIIVSFLEASSQRVRALPKDPFTIVYFKLLRFKIFHQTFRLLGTYSNSVDLLRVKFKRLVLLSPASWCNVTCHNIQVPRVTAALTAFNF